MLQAAGSLWLTRVRAFWAGLVTEVPRAWAVAAVRRGLLATAMISIGAFTPAFTPANSPWLAYLPWLGESQTWKLIATVLTLVGTLMLVDAWFQLRPRVHGPRPDLRVVVALWALPMLLGPPIFSQDSYAYAAEGWMLHNGENPYEMGVGMMPGPFGEQAVLVWRYTIAPYGPLSLQLSEFVVGLFNFNPYWSSTLGMRLLSIAGMALIAGCLPALARRFGADPATAIWFAVANPLAVTHFIGGAHNDAWMLGLVVLALWLATRGRFLLACVAVAAATAIKLPAIVVAVPVALIALPVSKRGTRWQREFQMIVHVSIASTLTVLAFVAISLATGLGWGWIEGLNVPGIVVTMAPWVLLGEVARIGLYELGLYDAGRRAVRIFRQTGMVATVVGILWLFHRWALRRPMDFVTAAIAAITVGGPALHPWYFTWASTLLPLTNASLLVRRIGAFTVTIGMYASIIVYCFLNDTLLLGIIAVVPFLWLGWINDRIHFPARGVPRPGRPELVPAH